jgi:hypothetical protein
MRTDAYFILLLSTNSITSYNEKSAPEWKTKNTKTNSMTNLHVRRKKETCVILINEI